MIHPMILWRAEFNKIDTIDTDPDTKRGTKETIRDTNSGTNELNMMKLI